MVKTRAKKPAAASKSQKDDTPKPTVPQLEPSVPNPPKVFILPKSATPEARIISLPNPATSTPSRYFVDPQLGFYEFTRVAAPKKTCKSWLLAPEHGEESVEPSDEGYVLQTPDLMIATPIDPLFLALPAFCTLDGGIGDQSWATLHDRLFLNDDDEASRRYSHLQSLLRSSEGQRLEKMLNERVRICCDVLDTGDGDDSLYKLDVGKLAAVVLEKAMRMVNAGLPASMEAHFVTKALEMPELSMRREESSISIVAEDAESESVGTSQGSATSFTTVESASTAATSLSATSQDQPSRSETTKITYLLRLRTALTYLTTNYIPAPLRSHLQPIFAGMDKPVNFSPLDKHLAHIAKLRAEAQALRSISDNISRKRGVLDDDEAIEKADAKKRKKEEEDAKKKSMSHGVKKLMKADTSGMKKMSSFFTAKAPVKK